MADVTTIKANIDSNITNQTIVDSISPAELGNQLKEIADGLVDRELYVATLTQTGTNNPVSALYVNEVAITWVRTDPGEYTGTFAGTFPLIILPTNIDLQRTGANTFSIVTAGDGILSNTVIKIEFYR